MSNPPRRERDGRLVSSLKNKAPEQALQSAKSTLIGHGLKNKAPEQALQYGHNCRHAAGD